MGNPSDMPELQEDVAAFAVHRVHNPPPGCNLTRGVDPGRVDISLPHRRDLRGLSDDQSGRGTLRVVLRRKIAVYAVSIGAVAGKRRHEGAVCQT
jgi:hypothetical protein